MSFLRYAIHFIFNLWVILVVIYNFVEKTIYYWYNNRI